MKSTTDEIRERFDHDVERFSNLETGQSATIDAPLAMELITRSAAATNPTAKRALDIGCGAGNYTLKLLALLPALDVELIDLSRPMLDRAVERIRPHARGELVATQGDVRSIELGPERFDVVMAAAVLHHLRGDDEWEAVFAKVHRALAPGGSFWISDLVVHGLAPVQALLWERYGAYLAGLNGERYRDHVFAYIEKEDTPRPVVWQLELLRRVGFRSVELLHKNGCFAAFGAVK